MAGFTVVQGDFAPAFTVVDSNGRVNQQADRFLRYLTLNGRSAYTVQSYARGIAHFQSWCARREFTPADIEPTQIQAYVADYRRGAGRERSAATTNHRLSVLSSFFDFLIAGEGSTPGRIGEANPVPASRNDARSMPMRKRPGRPRADLRRRLPRHPPTRLSADEIDAIYAAARSWRDKAMLKLLEWSGQRIGDWHSVHGRHGLLGLRLSDIDPAARSITVLQKGVRHQHVVPVAEPFWPLYQLYLTRERGAASHPAAWVSKRKGKGRPLSYATFETMLRTLRKRSGVLRLTAHVYRHTFAQTLLESTDSLALVQAFLGHSSPETTAARYAHVSFRRLVEAVRTLEEQSTVVRSSVAEGRTGYAFDYAPKTVEELERLTRGA
jgi:integrase/recombinase XerD